MTGETSWTETAFASMQQILRDELALGVIEMIDAADTEEIRELGEVSPIGRARVRRQPTFYGQMIEKGIDQLLHPTTSLRLAGI
jgi:hypothetical protein